MSEISADNINKKARLGRGLGSLLGGGEGNLGKPIPPARQDIPPHDSNIQTHQLSTQSEVDGGRVPTEARVWQIAIDKLVPSEFQPRTHFEKIKLEELSVSIKQNGILQPIVARRRTNGSFEIIAGERRWRAAQLAGLHEVPVILKSLENQNALEIAIIENIQRENLNPIEEAEAYSRLVAEFNLSQQQVAEKVGKDRATISNIMRLLALPLQVRDMVSAAEISTGHAKVLLSLPDTEKQLLLAKKVSTEKISVRQLEKLVAEGARDLLAPEPRGSLESGITDRLIKGLADELQKILGTKVTIDYTQSKGKISVHFYSDEELTQIVETLKEAHE
jgi:ParB family chromosome partitioning protein